MKNSKKGNVDKLTKLSGVGLRLQDKGNMQDIRCRIPMNFGDSLRMSRGRCCGFGMMNDKLLFADQAL